MTGQLAVRVAPAPAVTNGGFSSCGVTNHLVRRLDNTPPKMAMHIAIYMHACSRFFLLRSVSEASEAWLYSAWASAVESNIRLWITQLGEEGKTPTTNSMLGLKSYTF